MEGDQRRRGERGGDRHRRSLGQSAAPAPGADPRRDAGPQRRGEQEDAEHRREAELPADVARDPRLEGEQNHRREHQRVEARGAAASQGRQHAQRTHDPGALDRRTGAGKRHIDGDQAEHPEQTGAERQPERRQHWHRQQDEQRHVLTRYGEQVAQPGAAEVFRRRLVDLLVLAEHEAARQCRLPRRHSPAEGCLGASADLAAVGKRQHDCRRDQQKRH